MSSIDPDFHLRIYQKPHYYDSPDGEKPVEKVFAVARHGFVIGALTGIHDVIWFTKTKNATESLNCMAYWVVPFVAIGATWASVTYMATKIRGKCDYGSYILGAVACSPILHAWRKHTPFTLWTTAILIGVAVGAKHKANNGWKLVPEVKHEFGNYMYDFSLLKDVEDKDYRSPYKY